MDIAIIQTAHSPLNLELPAGMERVEIEELEGLTRHGHRVRFYANRVLGTREGVHQIADYERVGIFSDYWYALKAYLKCRSSDVILAHYLPKLALFSPQRCFIYFHGQAVFALPLKRFGWARKRYQKAQYIFCSRYVRDAFAQEHPEIDASRLHVLYNGVDQEKFSPRGKANAGRKRFSFHGRWARDKGILVLLEAVSMLESKRRDFECYLIGSPELPVLTPESRKTGELVMDRAAALSSVKLTGAVKQSDLPDLISTMDFGVVPSVYPEPFGIVNLEYMACGKPVVASAVGGIPEVVNNKVTGLLVQPDDPHKLAAAIEEMLDNDQKCRQMGEEARKLVLESFTWEKHIEQLMAIINDTGRQ